MSVEDVAPDRMNRRRVPIWGTSISVWAESCYGGVRSWRPNVDGIDIVSEYQHPIG